MSHIPIDFYFDFLSPFAYLARHRLVQIAEAGGATITYKPIDLARAKLAIGNTGPANRDMPVKLRYLVADLKRWAALYGIPLGYIGNTNSRLLNIGTFYAIGRNCAEEYVKEAFDMTWRDGGAPDDEKLLRELALRLAWVPDDFIAFLSSREATDAYEEINCEAIAKGVFGVPTMVVGDEMWWGNDRLFMLEARLTERSMA